MMGKSVRVNVSLPQPLHDVYAEWARVTGDSLSGAVLHGLRCHLPYLLRGLSMVRYQVREARQSDVLQAAGLESFQFDVEADVMQGLTRQQRRKLEREQRKKGGAG